MPALEAGICLNRTTGCNISGNSFIENGFAGISLLDSPQNLITGNNVSGSGWGGIHLMNSSRNTVSGNVLDGNGLQEGWGGGINGHVGSNYNNITDNVIANCVYGMFYHASTYNRICRNSISNTTAEGIWLQEQVSHNTVAENNLTNIKIGIWLQGPNSNNTLSSNSVTGAEYGIKAQSATNTRMTDNTIVNNRAGNDSWSAGIRLEGGADSQIRSNVVSGNHYGILLYSNSPRVSVYANNVTENDFGIRVASGGSSYFNATENVVANNSGYGIGATGFGSSSNYATISRNLIVNNSDGIALGQYSNYNTILQNNISQNGYGFYIEYSTQNTIWGNNVVGNDQQVYIANGSINNWNSSYATGGNQWSDYNGSDCRNGPSQNLAGCDGIGDTPNVFDSSNRDNYPIMKRIPWNSDDIGVTCLGKVGSQGASSMKTVIAEGTAVHFSVFVMNYGNDTETFNITTYVNSNLLETQTEITIAGKSYALANFTWNTSSFERGNYTISAQVTTVPGETDAEDNIYMCAVAVGVVGDVDNNGIVNMLDVYNIALHFGAIVGQADYVSNYDIDDNGIINMLDLYVAAMHYGQTGAMTESMVAQQSRSSGACGGSE
jgi:parallel beta-helix repeat protein